MIGSVIPSNIPARRIVTNGRYPNNRTGNHAALFVAHAGAGIWVMDQWKNDPIHKPAISMRHIPKRGGMRQDGSYPDASNNAEAYFVIELAK